MSKTIDVYNMVIALVKEIKEALVDTLWQCSGISAS